MLLRTYRQTTDLCFFLSAASVILFDHFPEMHWLLGSLLPSTGIVAVVVHFYVQSHPVNTVASQTCATRGTDAALWEASSGHLK